MRRIKPDLIYREVFEAIRHITYNPDPALSPILRSALNSEHSELTRDVLASILENHRLAPQKNIPLCQDTGTLVVFAEIGIDVQLSEPLSETINRALIAAQSELPLRASIVKEPLFERQNTRTNAPAILHISQVQGDYLKLIIAQKGGGAENMSFLRMFSPSVWVDELVDYIAMTVLEAGSRPCPPLILGIGIGGNFETAPLLAKRALFKPLGRPHPNPQYRELERGILERINSGACGAQGFGGRLTAVAVHIISAPCHIASLPVAVNVECHAHRHIEIEVSRETN